MQWWRVFTTSKLQRWPDLCAQPHCWWHNRVTQASSASIQHSTSNKKQLLTTLAPLLHSHSVKLATPCVLNAMFTSKSMSCDMRAGLIFSLIILLKNALCWKNVTLVKIHILKVQQSDPHTPTWNTRPGICRDVNLRSQGRGECRRPSRCPGCSLSAIRLSPHSHRHQPVKVATKLHSK